MEKLREQYEKEVIPALMNKFGYKSVMQVPKLDKIVINISKKINCSIQIKRRCQCRL